MKRLVIDLDDTLTVADSTRSYADVEVRADVVAKLRDYKAKGFEVVIHTARNMRTHAGNVGKITVHTLPIITEWLEKHDIPFDEIWLGKPWCGKEGFYVDDKAIRPDEFARLSYAEICDLVNISPENDPGQE
jgi:capsule biosynthesis phosphatase